MVLPSAEKIGSRAVISPLISTSELLLPGTWAEICTSLPRSNMASSTHFNCGSRNVSENMLGSCKLVSITASRKTFINSVGISLPPTLMKNWEINETGIIRFLKEGQNFTAAEQVSALVRAVNPAGQPDYWFRQCAANNL